MPKKPDTGDPRWDNDGLGEEIDAFALYVEQNKMSRAEIASELRELVAKRERQKGDD